MLARLAQESGIETPTAVDLARLDRKRKGKTLSNRDWVSGHLCWSPAAPNVVVCISNVHRTRGGSYV
jgi:hypothetical protein